MQRLFTIFTFTLLASFALAQPNPDVRIKQFSNLPALKHWAVEEPFGGGSLDILSHSGREIAIANRMLTSGLLSSEVTVFVRRSIGWDEALNLGPYASDSVAFKQDGDTVILKLANSGQELLRFSIQGMHRQREYHGKRHE